jgi:hypothetical protein
MCHMQISLCVLHLFVVLLPDVPCLLVPGSTSACHVCGRRSSARKMETAKHARADPDAALLSRSRHGRVHVRKHDFRKVDNQDMQHEEFEYAQCPSPLSAHFEILPLSQQHSQQHVHVGIVVNNCLVGSSRPTTPMYYMQHGLGGGLARILETLSQR